jgi:hypothetical protein
MCRILFIEVSPVFGVSPELRTHISVFSGLYSTYTFLLDTNNTKVLINKKKKFRIEAALLRRS